MTHALQFARRLVLALVCLAAPGLAGGVVAGRFGKALDASQQGAAAQAKAIYKGRPLTIECWARVNSRQGFQILRQPKRKLF